MASEEALRYLGLAEGHLQRVQAAWDEPTDWDDLSIYGLYCIEAAVMGAAEHAGMKLIRSHPGKMELAQRLASDYGLPDVANLMPDLNTARKAAAYGDTIAPELHPEEVASQIEEFFEAIRDFIEAND